MDGPQENEAILEAVLKRATITKHPWLMASDANTRPKDFDKSLSFRKDQMHVVAPEKASTCRSKSTKGEWIEKFYDCVHDYVFACNTLKGKISHMEVVEDSESRPHRAVSFVVEREKEMQEWNEQKMSKVLPGYSGGRLPGRSTEGKGREEGEPDDGRKKRKIRSDITQEVVANIKEEASGTARRIENEEEWEKDWQEEDQMAAQ